MLWFFYHCVCTFHQIDDGLMVLGSVRFSTCRIQKVVPSKMIKTIWSTQHTNKGEIEREKQEQVHAVKMNQRHPMTKNSTNNSVYIAIKKSGYMIRSAVQNMYEYIDLIYVCACKSTLRKNCIVPTKTKKKHQPTRRKMCNITI